MPIVENRYGSMEYQMLQSQGSYPTYALPPIIREAVEEVSRNLNVPVELAAQAALGVVSLACQNFANILCPRYEPAPCSLDLLTVSNSSDGKSVMMQRFLRGVSEVERKWEDEVAARMSHYRAEHKIWLDDDRRLAKEYLEATKDSDEARRIREERVRHEKNRPVAPSVRKLWFAELSPQGLRDLLATHGALGILSAEASPALNGQTFGQPAMYSDYWSGVDRPVGLVSGSRRAVEPRLTIAVMVQKGGFSDYMNVRGDEAFDTGLLARFLPAAPQTVDFPGQQTLIEDILEPGLELFNERVKFILNQTVPAPYERTLLRLAEGAKYCWKAFKEAINNDLASAKFSERIKLFLRKLAQQASRIAALFHYFEGKSGDISSETMKNAIALCEWYAFEYVRVFSPYAPSQQQKDAEAAQKLLDWLQKAFSNWGQYPKLTRGRYTERDLNNYSSIRGDSSGLENAINTLHAQGQISISMGRKNGRIIIFPPVPMSIRSLPPYQTPPPYQTLQTPAYFNPSPTMPPNATFENPGVPARPVRSIDRPNESAQMPVTPFPGDGWVDPEMDSDQMRLVREKLQRDAIEAGIGPVTMTATIRRG